MRSVVLSSLLLISTLCVPLPAAKNPLKGLGKKNSEPSALDKLIEESKAVPPAPSSPGSLYSADGRLADMARDFRAYQVNDLVTVVISDRVSAVATGTTSTDRKSSANATVGALAGLTRTPGPWSSLADASGETKLNGQGTTTRNTNLSTTLSARITHVLPNGNLIIEGVRDISVNSEVQRVQVRGVLRWSDLSSANNVASDRLADLEVRINGKGVVNDAIRRPGFLYRLILGILPF